MNSGPPDPREIVARTLAHASWAFAQDERGVSVMGDLGQLLDEIRRCEPDSECCPFCEEVECDNSCPLADWRGHPASPTP